MSEETGEKSRRMSDKRNEDKKGPAIQLLEI